MPEDNTIDPATQLRANWLQEITGRAALSAKNLAETEARKKGQEMISLRLGDDARQAIRDDMLSITIKVEAMIGTKKMSILDEDGEYMNEIDTRHHTKKITESLAPADMKKLNDAMAKILALQEEMKKSPVYNAGEPDFVEVPTEDPADFPEPQRTEIRKALLAAVKLRSEQEAEYDRRKAECDARLAEDLWLPLHREGIIPENFVPQEMSSVANQFKASSELYEDRLQEYSASLTEKDILKEKFDLGFKIGKATLKMATAGLGVAGSVATLTDDKALGLDIKQATEIMGYLSTALTITEGVSTAILTDRDFTSVGDVVAVAVGDVLSANVGPEIGGMVSAAISSAARGVRTAKMVKAGNYQEAAMALVEGIAKGCAGFDKTDGKYITEIGAQIRLGMTSFIAGWNIGAAVARGDSAKDMMQLLVAEFEKVAGAAAKTQGGKIATEFAKGLEDKVVAKTTALNDAAIEKITGKAKKEGDDEEEEEDEEDDGEPGLLAVLSDRSEAAKLIAAKFDNVALMKQREETAKKMSEDMQAMIEEEGAEFRLALVTGFNMASDDEEEVDIGESNRLASIDYILAVQRKNDATFALCKSIATIGVGLVTKLFPGASLVGACLTLAFTIQDAIAKTEELIIWTANFKDAQAASSAQVDAFLNRKGLQTEQTARAAIQVALDAAKVVAEVLKLTPAGPAGPVVQASAVAAEAAIELTAILYTEVQMARAWKIYEKARDDPADRYLARKATQANPTLAKYAMAWGATKGDVIAVEGMRRCGLNEHTLSLPETNVAKVVEYLEAKYADDPVLLRAVPVKQKWHPGPVVLSLSSWASFYQMATTEAVPAVTKTNDISGINAALGSLDGAEARFSTEIERLFDVNKARKKAEVDQDPFDPDEAVTATLLSAIYKLRDNLRRFKSIDVAGTPHKEMAQYIDALAAKTDQRLKGIENILNDRKWSNVYSDAA